jgi:peptidoglycan/xylan/chitin deacetylase (PgdA/CDA1 family)
MKTSRVLLISNVRPSRTWNFANRVLREVPGTEICGVVQRPVGSIPWIQQLIAAGKTREISLIPRQWVKVRFLFHSLVDKVVAWFFWFVHGCPPSPNDSTFTMKRLKQECARAGWLFTVAGEYKEAAVAALPLTDVNLTIVLGEFFSLPEFAINASNGCIRVRTCRPSANGESSGDALISIEHLASGTGAPSLIFSQWLPWQPFDGPLGFTLKADLITDDLVLQSTRGLLASNPETASTEVSEWANKILAPSLSQLESAHEDMPQAQPGGKRCRSPWKLCLDTLLLLSPGILGRNWYRRLGGRYPVLILAHHLVSDRPHRMGVPTETFWRQVLFLKKHYRIVNLAEASELLRSGQIRVPTVVLTFDDGYADNFLGLRAVTNEMVIPSTLFVTTGPVEAHREFDHDLATGKTGFLPLTWDQIAYWNSRGAEFGSHTREHFDCGSEDLEHLQSEIIGSRQDLEAHVKKPVTFFAFPYGKQKNMSRVAMDLAASTYRHYVSSFGGEALANGGRPQSHLFRKKFYGSPWELELELQSVFDFVDTLRQWFHSQAASSSNESSRVPVVSTLSPSIQTISSSSASTSAYSRVEDSYGVDGSRR